MKITPGGVVAAEWTKFSSLRSTWITTGVSAFLLIAFGMIASASFSGNGMSAVDLALGGSTLAALAVGVLGVLLGAGEYTTGMIRSTLAAVPRRLPVLWSKSLVAGLAAFVVMTIGAFVAFALGGMVLNSAIAGVSLGDDGVLRALFGAGLYLGLVAVLGVALGILVRSSAGAIAILAGGLLILPGLVPLLPNAISDAISPYLPSSAGSAVMSLTHSDGSLGPWAGLAVFAGYVVVTLGAAAYRLKKTDA
ncbi:ABC-type transport system involved in multi-copper enzyme maturation permease subunit [Actinoplanes tereljensis]|uniref:ABC transporter permease n=1 Tax=Paractinoplanes tereljensis TaxID=571912 RepID=A0A919NMW7_9ACTN|nr:ABC transporter permease [Actinoplanes tereljensis]GIF21428.1 ABC transporter permease [Actinoplanes tereljensis]